VVVEKGSDLMRLVGVAGGKLLLCVVVGRLLSLLPSPLRLQTGGILPKRWKMSKGLVVE
jgi:hypothetical protein